MKANNQEQYIDEVTNAIALLIESATKEELAYLVVKYNIICHEQLAILQYLLSSNEK